MNDSGRRQSYGLGWAYVALPLLRAAFATLVGGDNVLAALCFAALASSAAVRAPLSWHVVCPADRRSSCPSWLLWRL